MTVGGGGVEFVLLFRQASSACQTLALTEVDILKMHHTSTATSTCTRAEYVWGLHVAFTLFVE